MVSHSIPSQGPAVAVKPGPECGEQIQAEDVGDGTSGGIYRDLREQGRPQGSGFGPGPIPPDAGRAVVPGHRRVSLLSRRRDRGLRHRLHGASERQRVLHGSLLRRPRRSRGDHLRRLPAAALRRRRPDRPAAQAGRARRHRRARRLRRQGADLPDLGAGRPRSAQGGRPSARPVPGPDPALASEPGGGR